MMQRARLTTEKRNPRSARMDRLSALGIVKLINSEDRKVAGIVPDLSVRENILLVLQTRRGWWRPIPRRRQSTPGQSDSRCRPSLREQVRSREEWQGAIDLALADKEE